ncbi:MAG TPA: DNA polymerase IV, partial [Allosphingosinicella sp.]
DRPYKSVSAEDTFLTDLGDGEALLAELDRIGRHVWQRIEAKGLSGRTVNLKVKYHDFQIVTRSRSLDRPVSGHDEFIDIGATLLRSILPAPKSIRLLGLGLSNLTEGTSARARELELPL